jgi:hypothetical protein
MKAVAHILTRLKEMIRSFFIRFNRSDLKIFGFFLLVSSLYWFFLTLDEGFVIERKTAVHYVTDHNKQLPDSIFTDTLYYKVKTKGWFIFGSDVPKKINAPVEWYNSPGKLKLLENLLYKNTRFKQQLQGTQLIGNPGAQKYAVKKAAVRPDYTFVPKPGYFIKNIEFYPDSIWIFGKKNLLKNVNEISTAKKKIENIQGKRLFSPPLDFPEGIYGVENKIRLRIEAYPFVRKETEVPLQLPDSLKNKLIVFPSSVRIYYKEYIEPGKKNPKNGHWVVGIKPDTTTDRVFVPVILEKPRRTFDIDVEPGKIEYLYVKRK